MQAKKRLIVLEKLVEEFEPDRAYPEMEVNQILLDFFDDYAILRREIVDFGYMERERGIYRRLASPGESSGAGND